MTILLCFGPCIVWYAATLLTASHNPFEIGMSDFGSNGLFFALALALPVASYTVAILHANNVRDIASDAKAR